MSDAFGRDAPPPLILTKKVKVGGGHHGGAWKVAYADFVTAMMAFFLLLWLLNATTEEQVDGLSEYFAPSNVSDTKQGLGEALSGLSPAPEGALRSDSARPSVSVAIPSFGSEAEGEESGKQRESVADAEVESNKASEEEPDRQRLDEALAELRQSITETPETAELQENLVMDRAPEGLRIQILDRADRGMFESGTAELTQRAIRLLALIGSVVADLPNDIAITGHTDASPPPGGDPAFTNWELSAARAASARKWLVEAGLPTARIVAVSGKADSDLLEPERPDAPRNRRVSILIARAGGTAAGGEAAGGSAGEPAPPPLPAADSPSDGT